MYSKLKRCIRLKAKILSNSRSSVLSSIFHRFVCLIVNIYKYNLLSAIRNRAKTDPLSTDRLIAISSITIPTDYD